MNVTKPEHNLHAALPEFLPNGWRTMLARKNRPCDPEGNLAFERVKVTVSVQCANSCRRGTGLFFPEYFFPSVRHNRDKRGTERCFPSSMGMGGMDISAGTIGSVMRGAQNWGKNTAIENYTKKKGSLQIATALRSQWGFGDSNGKAQLASILDGTTTVQAGNGAGDAKTVLGSDGRRTVTLNGYNDSMSSEDQLLMGITLQHEAYRDGADKSIESRTSITKDAVRARTKMAYRMAGDTHYGKSILYANEGILKDSLMYSVSLVAGDQVFNDYVDENFDSTEEYAKRYENWEKSGMIGVQEGDGNPVLNFISDLSKVVSGKNAIDNMGKRSRGVDITSDILTEQPPTEAQDWFTIADTLLTIGQVGALSTTSKKGSEFIGKTTAALFNIPLSREEFIDDQVKNGVLQMLGTQEIRNYTQWNGEPNRDGLIFDAAEKMGINLAVPYDPATMSKDQAKQLENQMIERYRTLGNLMFNGGIKDDDELKMVMFGSYERKDVSGIGQSLDGKPGITVPQYVHQKGFLETEQNKYSLFDTEWMIQDAYIKYQEKFTDLNAMMIAKIIKGDGRSFFSMTAHSWNEYNKTPIGKYDEYLKYANEYSIKQQNLLLQNGTGGY